MDSPDKEDEVESLSETEIDALHEFELCIEHLERAHGELIAFHHSTGRAMNRLAAAENKLREAGHDEFADQIRDDFLPRGVLEGRRADDAGRWSYDVLETYEDVFLNDMLDFWETVADTVADGRQHIHERRQERTWKGRARRD